MHNIINIKLTIWLGINHSGWALQSDGSFFSSDIDATYENFLMVLRVVQNFFLSPVFEIFAIGRGVRSHESDLKSERMHIISP